MDLSSPFRPGHPVSGNVPLEQKVTVSEKPHTMQFFSYEHLPSHLQEVSKVFSETAAYVTVFLPDNPQRDLALSLLLMAKDAAVRAKLAKPHAPLGRVKQKGVIDEAEADEEGT